MVERVESKSFQNLSHPRVITNPLFYNSGTILSCTGGWPPKGEDQRDPGGEPRVGGGARDGAGAEGRGRGSGLVGSHPLQGAESRAEIQELVNLIINYIPFLEQCFIIISFKYFIMRKKKSGRINQFVLISERIPVLHIYLISVFLASNICLLFIRTLIFLLNP